jgi:hypothetical protein
MVQLGGQVTLPMPRPSRSTPALPPSPSAAAISIGSTGVGRARLSCARPSSNGWRAPSRTRSGRAPSTSVTAPKALPTTPPSAPWPSNGSASSSAAGLTARPTMNLDTSQPSRSDIHRCSNSRPPTLHKSLAVRLRARVGQQPSPNRNRNVRGARKSDVETGTQGSRHDPRVRKERLLCVFRSIRALVPA